MLTVGAVWSAVLLTRILVVVTAAVIVGIAGEVADQRVDRHQGDEALLHRLDARRFELTRGPLSRLFAEGKGLTILQIFILFKKLYSHS